MKIKINKTFHPRSVELMKALDEGRIKLELAQYHFGTLIQYYEIALANDFKNAAHKIEHELELQDRTDWIVPRDVFQHFNPSMLGENYARKVWKGEEDWQSLIVACYEYFPPSFGLMVAYILAVSFGKDRLAAALQKIIKAHDSLSDCMPHFLELAQHPDISARIADLAAIVQNDSIEEQIDGAIEEDIEKHDTLNPLLFEGDKLKTDVREQCLAVANQLIETLEENQVPFKLKDLIITGSNASYNYTKDSDLDLHLVADLSEVTESKALYSIIFDAFKSAFNRKFSIDFYGVPVEVYIESEGTPLVSNGIYSILTDSWVKEPVNEAIPEIDLEEVAAAVEPWETRYKEIDQATDRKTCEDESEIDKYIDELYALRAKGLSDGGEYSTENLVFKEIRNKGYLDNLKELRDIIIANKLSL